MFKYFKEDKSIKNDVPDYYDGVYPYHEAYGKGSNNILEIVCLFCYNIKLFQVVF